MNSKVFKKEKIGEVSEKIFSGGTPNTRTPEYWDGSLNWLSSGETRSRFITETEKHISELGAKKSSTRLAKFGDVVLASSGQGYTRGQVSLLLTDSYINQSVIAIRVDETRLLTKYLFYNLSNRYEELRAISDSNSIRGSITTKMIASMEIVFPSLEYQRSIVGLLESIDERIENNRKINHHLVH